MKRARNIIGALIAIIVLVFCMAPYMGGMRAPTTISSWP